jgi:hypothetical protein
MVPRPSQSTVSAIAACPGPPCDLRELPAAGDSLGEDEDEENERVVVLHAAAAAEVLEAQLAEIEQTAPGALPSVNTGVPGSDDADDDDDDDDGESEAEHARLEATKTGRGGKTRRVTSSKRRSSGCIACGAYSV